MEKFNKIKERGLRIAATVSSHHTGAFAAQAAYFFVLSLIPIFMLLLTMVQFTPVTKADVMEAVLPVFPSTVSPMIESIVNQVYMTSSSIIPVTILVALWSAGKGVLSVTYGLNCKIQRQEIIFICVQEHAFIHFCSLWQSCFHWYFPYSVTVSV